MAAKVVLYSGKDGSGLSNILMENDRDLKATGTFLSAHVDKGQWIAYRQADYNPQSWGSDNMQMLTQGVSGAVNLKFGPGSIRRVQSFGSEGVTVYEHNDYCGREQHISSSATEVDVGGASSIIISGGRYTLYTKPHFGGQSLTLEPGLYPTPQAMGFPNDTLGSIQKRQ